MIDSFDSLVYHVPQELFVPSAFKEFDGIFFPKTLSGQFDSYTLKNEIEYKLSITNTGDAFLLTGIAQVDAITKCSRCLDDVQVKLDAKIDSYYLINPPESIEQGAIDEFEILSSDHNIPIGLIIKQSLLIDAPYKPLCKSDCKGLCSNCGVNLNTNTCSCSNNPDPTNSFSVLKDLKL